MRNRRSAISWSSCRAFPLVSSADLQTRKQYSDALNMTQQLLLSDQIMSAAIYQSASQQLQAAVDKVNQSALQQQQ